MQRHNLQHCSKEKGALLLQVATTLPGSAAQHEDMLVRYIADGKITSNDQVLAAAKYFKSHAAEDALNQAEFDKACGVGVVVTPDDISAAVTAAIRQHEGALKEERYHFNTAKLIQPVKQHGDVAWAPISSIRAEIDRQVAELLGPKTAEDEKPKGKPAKAKQKGRAPAAKVRRCREELSKRWVLLMSQCALCSPWHVPSSGHTHGVCYNEQPGLAAQAASTSGLLPAAGAELQLTGTLLSLFAGLSARQQR